MIGLKMTENVHSDAIRILVVDDEPEIRMVAKDALERRGYQVAEAGDGEAALSAVLGGAVDLMVLDVNLPRMSGLAVLALMRPQSQVPVILLTGRGNEPDRVSGLELGADDYVVKPFSPAELAARVTSVLRRSSQGLASAPFGEHPHRPAAHATGSVVVRVPERQVMVAGRAVDLTRKEFDLLACLASSPRRVFSRAELLEQVWESALDWQDPSTVTEHARRLRQKIEADPAHPCWIQTVRGVGYRFDAEPNEIDCTFSTASS